MKRLMIIKVGLLVVLALTIGLAAASVTFGQSGKVETPAPPPKPLPTPAALDLGKIEGSTYSNEQLGFSFSAPAKWTVRDDKSSNAILEEAKRVIGDEKDPKLKAALEGSVERTTILFTATKFVLGTAGTSGALNASLSCAAERIPTALISTPRDYYDVMLRSLNRAEGIKVDVIEPFQVKKIGATEFGIYTIKITTNINVVIQKQLITIRAPYAVGLFFSYIDNEDASSFDEVVNSIKAR